MITDPIYRERIKKWVAYLRSGKFVQGFGKLNRDGAMCCLAVACQLYQDETLQGDWVKNELGNELAFVQASSIRPHLGDFNLMPAFVADWLGINDEGRTDHVDPTWRWNVPNAGSKAASKWNDQSRLNFEQIARMIEDNYLQENNNERVET